MSGQPLQGEIALVTGASRGIGAAIADELARLGATVIGTATSDAGAAAIGDRSVSYTHLDVYKRQCRWIPRGAILPKCHRINARCIASGMRCWMRWRACCVLPCSGRQHCRSPSASRLRLRRWRQLPIWAGCSRPTACCEAHATRAIRVGTDGIEQILVSCAAVFACR